MPQELTACVERANLDPSVHVIALSGNGKGSPCAPPLSAALRARVVTAMHGDNIGPAVEGAVEERLLELHDKPHLDLKSRARRTGLRAGLRARVGFARPIADFAS